MENAKRKDVEEGGDDTSLVVKKQKTGELAVASGNQNRALATTAGGFQVERTSSLQAPIMLLSGHKAEVFSVEFSPSGKHIASGSFDKTIYLWNTYGECDNYMVLKGHQNAVLDLHWNREETHLVSCSADKNIMIWDVESGQRTKKYGGHVAVVNSVSIAKRNPFIVSGADDGSIRMWDTRVRNCVETLSNGRFAVTAVCFAETFENFYTGGIDNNIKVWDWRKLKDTLMTLDGHTDTVTGLSLSHDGSYLLSNAMDNRVCIWDVRPFVNTTRLQKEFAGVQHNFEKTLLRCAWSKDGSKISAGSADRFVYVWDTTTRKILYKLPGHRGTVNAVDFHPQEPIIASASSDHSIYLGEIKP
eukprot:TRINITY_DN2181_c0_g1_i1.p1 TRINITY_DN2181_c0_g1~~TRINITY_DN2181_c0_g1_i1.p1  ORF type:complete len:359 (+),score=77.79 TRINITY_DN2181_c0_g1_i1:118-1194(+)